MSIFSVIIPVYNVGCYLSECLASLESQIYRDWEGLCIDDGSLDDSGQILDDAVRRDQRIRVFHRPNRGVSCARNIALWVTVGEYVTFLDADDVVAEDWLDNYVHFFKVTDVDLVKIGFTSWEGRYPLMWTDGGSFRVYGGTELKSWGTRTFCRHGFVWSYAVRRSCVINVMFPLGMSYKEDLIFSLQLLVHVSKACQTAYKGYFYRRRVGSATAVRRSSFSCLRVLDELVNLIRASAFYDSAAIRAELAWNGWADVCGWSSLAKDWVWYKAIHRRFNELSYGISMCSLLHGRWHWVSAYVLYDRFGFHWPIRLTWILLMFISKFGDVLQGRFMDSCGCRTRIFDFFRKCHKHEYGR